MEKNEKTKCTHFVNKFFERKNFKLTIPKNTSIKLGELKKQTINGLLEGNEKYKTENKIPSIYDFEIGTDFLNNLIHKEKIQEKIPLIIQNTNYASSVSGQYKIFVISTKLK